MPFPEKNDMSAIGGHQNQQGTRPRSLMRSDVWLTPPEIIKTLGPFDLDPCSLEPRPWPTAEIHYAPPQDGLALPWHGRIWLNPPYGKQTAVWLAKLAEHGAGTALVFARTETKFFFNYIWREASALLFLEGRLDFCLPDGTKSRYNAGAPSVLVAYGNYDVERLAQSDIGGAFVPLPNRGQVVVAFSVTWLQLVASIFKDKGGRLALSEMYVLLSDHPKARRNQNWKAKLRQVVQGDLFERVASGVYRLRH
jgi:hypothetical protein